MAFQGTMEPQLSKHQLSKCSIIQNGLQCVQKYALHVFPYPDALWMSHPEGLKLQLYFKFCDFVDVKHL